MLALHMLSFERASHVLCSPCLCTRPPASSTLPCPLTHKADCPKAKWLPAHRLTVLQACKNFRQASSCSQKAAMGELARGRGIEQGRRGCQGVMSASHWRQLL